MSLSVLNFFTHFSCCDWVFQLCFVSNFFNSFYDSSTHYCAQSWNFYQQIRI